MDYLFEFCVTDRQREVLQAVIDNGGMRPAARALNCNAKVVDRILSTLKKRAASKGVAPDRDLNHQLPDGFSVRGVSSYYNKDGVLSGQWVKSQVDAERQAELMREVIDALVSDLPKVDPRDNVVVGNEDLMAVYPLGDAHIGMRAWREECGEDWDLSIAEQKFIGVFDRLVKTAPKCKRAVIVDLGDWMHADNMRGTTERSDHHLDVDGRFGKMAYVAVRILRRMIESALDHHENVEVICNIGNHNDTSAQLVAIALMNVYENEPRLVVHHYAKPFHYIIHGDVLIGTHHGHTCKGGELPLVMATDMAKEWGCAKFRYWYTGHIHHDTVKEYAGCKVESFRTVAAKDSYAAWNGYRSGRDSKCVVHHRHYGEVERHTVCVEQVA